MAAPIVLAPKWLVMRADKKLGSSQAAGACGENQQCSRLELWAEMVGRVPRVMTASSELLYWGNALEPIICRVAAHRAGLYSLDSSTAEGRLEIEAEIHRGGGCHVEAWVLSQDPDCVLPDRYQPWVLNNERPWQSTTLDHSALDKDGGFWPVEVKNQAQWRAKEWESGDDDDEREDDEDDAPPPYKIQLAHHAAVIEGSRGGLLAALIGGNRMELRAEKREDLPIDALNALEREFMQYVFDEEKPPVTVRDEAAYKSIQRALKGLHPQDNGKVIQLPLELEAFIPEREELTLHIRSGEQAKKRRKQIDIHFKAALADATFALLRDGREFSFKTQDKKAQAATSFRVLRLSK